MICSIQARQIKKKSVEQNTTSYFNMPQFPKNPQQKIQSSASHTHYFPFSPEEIYTCNGNISLQLYSRTITRKNSQLYFDFLCSGRN